MSTMSIAEISKRGMFAGAGIALAPATATLLIASSRAIFVNLLANAILRTLTAGAVGIDIYGLSLIQVPLLWKISKVSAVVGASISALSMTVFLANKLYLLAFDK